jgi:hypothetical protein
MRALTRLVASLRRRGIAATLKIIRALAEDALFDLRHGVRTGGQVDLKNLDVVGENKERGIYYQPIKSSLFLPAMRSFAIPPDGVFVDFGSGKGRALMLALVHGFRHAVGVEFAQELASHAERNLARFRARAGRHFDAQVLNIDATRYPVTAQDRVFFLYNPFQEEILTQVLNNIRASLQAAPRPVHIVYANPVHRHVLDNDPFWHNAGEFQFNGLETMVHYQPRATRRAH